MNKVALYLKLFGTIQWSHFPSFIKEFYLRGLPLKSSEEITNEPQVFWLIQSFIVDEKNTDKGKKVFGEGVCYIIIILKTSNVASFLSLTIFEDVYVYRHICNK